MHIEETHDSFFAVTAAKKPNYSCYVEECGHKSIDASARRDHCIKDHKFPHDFRFDKVRKQKKKKDKGMEVDESSEDVKQEAAKVFEVPKGFHFGHNSVKGFVKPKKPKKSMLESESMMTDLMESLP